MAQPTDKPQTQTTSIIARGETLKTKTLEVTQTNIPGYDAGAAIDTALSTLSSMTVKAGNDYVPAVLGLDPNSVISALRLMVNLGLRVDLGQCSLIPRRGRLTCEPTALGDAAIVKRLTGMDIYSHVVREGDVFETELRFGRHYIKRHETSLDNADAPIRAAYAGFLNSEGKDVGVVIKTRSQIEEAWLMSETYGPWKREKDRLARGEKADPEYKGGNTEPPHVRFEEEFCQRTVRRVACKTFIAVGGGQEALIQALDTTDAEYIDVDVPDDANSIYLDDVVEATSVDTEAAATDTQ